MVIEGGERGARSAKSKNPISGLQTRTGLSNVRNTDMSQEQASGRQLRKDGLRDETKSRHVRGSADH
jgi:hypothetical protein